MENEKLVIISKEMKKFEIDIKFKKVSQLIHNILEDSPPTEEIPVDISTSLLEKVLEYATMHNFNPPEMIKPIKSNNLKDNLNEKDYNYIKNFNYETIKPLLMTACYLDIKNLEDLCISFIATEFYFEPTNEGIQKIKKKFGLIEEIKPEDEELLRKEYPWAFIETEQFPSNLNDSKNEKNG